MKKKIILFAAGAVLLAASAFTFASVNKSSDPMDDLFRANVEALTANEADIKVSCAPATEEITCDIIVFFADGSSRLLHIPYAVRVYFTR